MKKALLKNFAIFTGKLQDIKNTLQHTCKCCKIFKKSFLRRAQWAAASVLTLLLSSDNLLTGYEQVSY